MIEWLYKYDMGEPANETKGKMVQVGNRLWKLGYISTTLKMHVLDLENVDWIQVSCKNSISVNIALTQFSSDSRFIYVLKMYRKNEFWKFDTSALEWTHVANISNEMRGMSHFELFNNNIYTIMRNLRDQTTSLKLYNVETHESEEKRIPVAYQDVRYINIFRYSGLFHVIVIKNGFEAQIYQLNNDKLSLIHSAPISINHFMSINIWTSDNCLYLYSTYMKYGYFVELHCFDFETLKWNQIDIKKTAMDDCSCGTFHIGGNIYGFFEHFTRNTYALVGVEGNMLETVVLLQMRENFKNRVKNGETIEVIEKEIDDLMYPEGLKRKIRDSTLWCL